MEVVATVDGIYLVTAHAQYFGSDEVEIVLQVRGGVNIWGGQGHHFATGRTVTVGDFGRYCGVNVAFETPIREGEGVYIDLHVNGTSLSNVERSLTADWRAPADYIPNQASG